MTIHLRFLQCKREAENVASFLFQPESPLEFQAGQYLQVLLPHVAPDHRGISRSFSIASSPREPLIRLTTRLSSPGSSFKRALAKLQPGAVLDASGPFGDFVYADDGRAPVFIAGGIGITPIRSILDDLACRTPRISATLLYSNASHAIPFRTELDALMAGWPELQVVYTVSRPEKDWRGRTGRIDAHVVEEYVPDPAGSRFFVCGPTPMVSAMREILVGMGVETDQVIHEGFPGYESLETVRHN
jgi:ferredoxin-NADP reductase